MKPPSILSIPSMAVTRWKQFFMAASLLAMTVLALSTPKAAPAPEPPANPPAVLGDRPPAIPFQHPKTLWELIVAGGPMMIPIGLCSLVALAIALERLFSLRRNRIIPPGFMKGLVVAFGPDGTNIAGALAYCDRTPSPLSNIIRAGILKLGRRLEILEQAVQDAATSEVARLRRGLETLAIVGTISPLLGLLGTIYGMIGAFRSAAQHGLGRGELLASGIYVALITTAAGLTVAIPALLLYYYFLSRIESLADEFEAISNEFLDQCHDAPGTAVYSEPPKANKEAEG
ncbi:MAG: MotA/TolQ/ExbB proton channel family protein [Candidatus Sumerlaeia bacterium]|nr:MotA/TolQ/ExbB proton channel family protein [Candidatus Sumerlaeia bacterium]